MMCYGDPLQLQSHTNLASGLVDHFFFCRLSLYLFIFYIGNDKSHLCLQTDVGTGLWQDHCDGGGWRWLVFSFCIITNFVCKSLYLLYLV